MIFMIRVLELKEKIRAAAAESKEASYRLMGLGYRRLTLLGSALLLIFASASRNRTPPLCGQLFAAI
jgi:hypothetical protein